MKKQIAIMASFMLAFSIVSVIAGPGQQIGAAGWALFSTGMGAGSPSVSITKECPSIRYVGRNAEFKITVSNTGSGDAQNVVVTDRIPAGINFLSADNGGSRQGNNLVWRIGTLPAGKSVVLMSKFACNTIGDFTNTATVQYCASDEASCNLQVKGIPAILIECVDNPDPIEVGSNVTYTITVTNQGTAVGTNIRLACTLPPQEEFVSADGPTRGNGSGKSVTFDPLPSLAPKATATFRVVVKGASVGDVRFRVEMNSDQLTSPVMETESTNIY